MDEVAIFRKTVWILYFENSYKKNKCLRLCFFENKTFCFLFCCWGVGNLLLLLLA